MMPRSGRVWLAFLGVFIAGAVAGGFVSLRLVKRPAEPPDDIALKIMQRYADRLELTPDQQAVIQPYVMRAAAEMHRTRAEAAEAMQALEQGVARVLTPEQEATLETMQAEQRARWKKWVEKKRMLERKDSARDSDGGKPHHKPTAPTP